MKVWKIRHKPTGLYYKPFGSGKPSNLSTKGKVYTQYPNIMAYTNGVLRLDYNTYVNTTKDDWEIEEH